MAARVFSSQVSALVCIAAVASLSRASPVPPRVLQSATNLALVPRTALPANFTVLSVALLPDPAAANVTLLPLTPPTLDAVPHDAISLAKQLPLAPLQPPDLPESAAPGEAYVLSHVIIEVGVLDDDNSTDNATSEYDDSVLIPEAEPVQGKKSEALKAETKDDNNEDDVKKQDKEVGKNCEDETDKGDGDKTQNNCATGKGENKEEKKADLSRSESTVSGSGKEEKTEAPGKGSAAKVGSGREEKAADPSEGKAADAGSDKDKTAADAGGKKPAEGQTAEGGSAGGKQGGAPSGAAAAP